MTVSVFVGTSLDGFIARPNDDLDWLPAGGGEPHGYDEFIASVDAIVIGRKTFEKVLTFGAWPYGDKRVVVLSSRPVDLTAAGGGFVEHMAGPPPEIVSRLPRAVPITSTSTVGPHPTISQAGLIDPHHPRARAHRRRIPLRLCSGTFGSVTWLRSIRERFNKSEYAVTA
jgi:dihydrofolate reductase